jgi:microcystin-dependent protein
MPYKVYFTDESLNPEPIDVADNTSNVDTSLVLPGRNVTGYGRFIAENFLHLLENFASDIAPSTSKAVIGQLWYNSGEDKLYVFDGVGWKTTSNIKTAVNEPDDADTGDLWVNTSTQQLYLFSGSTWILVGPQFSQGSKSGPLVESIIDIDNIARTIIVFYADDIPVTIISRHQFTPKTSIQGFSLIRTGINLTTRSDIGVGSLAPKLIGIATSAESLYIGATEVPASSFIRSDQPGTIQSRFNVRDNTGVTVGTDGNLRLGVSNANALIYNATAGAAIDLQTSRSGQPNTILRVINERVGINNQSPAQALDVIGNTQISGEIVTSSTTNATNLNNGSIRTSGGLAVAKDLVIGGNIELLNGILKTKSIEPLTDAETIGKSDNKFNTIYVRNIVADVIEGTLSGNIDGNSFSATSLQNTTNFKLEGDVSSNSISFNGTGNLTKTFTTQLTSDIISNKASLGTSRDTDELLVYRATAGLRKVTRQVFFDDLTVPIGAIFPWAGQADSWEEIPQGYLLCDGSEVETYRYRALYNVVGNLYNGDRPLTTVTTSGGTFRLPDLRGRFPLGYQLMDNSLSVPFPSGAAANISVNDRVTNPAANSLGENSGTGGSSEYVIQSFNIPDHDHDLRSRTSTNTTTADATTQFYVINSLTTNPTNLFAPSTDIASVRNLERTAYATVANTGQRMPTTGLVRISDENRRTPGELDSLIGRPLEVMNPFLTINYIIRSGKPIEDA